MEKISVFLDTNVIIASLLSDSGASCKIIKNSSISKIISKTITAEIIQNSKRLNINSQDINLITEKITTVSLKLNKNTLFKKYGKYVSDIEDSHVAAGAHKSKTRFLLTHNIKDFVVEKIFSDFGIIVLKPGNFLQYLRSLK